MQMQGAGVNETVMALSAALGGCLIAYAFVLVGEYRERRREAVRREMLDEANRVLDREAVEKMAISYPEQHAHIHSVLGLGEPEEAG